MRDLSDLAPLLCAPDTPIGDVLIRLNATPDLFQVVVDADRHPLGTITDGDIRRAMLRGVDLDARADQCMAVSPKVGHDGDESGNRRLIATVPMSAPFLPVVDSGGRLTRILVGGPGVQPIRTALVMAGGFGRRLGHRTRMMPKPLLPIAGVPILERTLSALEGAGVTDIFISVHYLADNIRQFVAARGNGAKVTLVSEDKPLGTIGALGLLPDSARRSTLLVLNGDVLTELDLTAVGAFHERYDHDGTIVVQRHIIDIPYGVVRIDSDGLFDSIDEKPCIVNHIAGGIYVLGPGFADRVAPGEPLDMPDLLNRGRADGLRIGLFPLHEYWVDIGRPDDLVRANATFDAGVGTNRTD